MQTPTWRKLVYSVGIFGMAVVNVIFVILFIIAFNFYLLHMPKPSPITTHFYVPPDNPASWLFPFRFQNYFSGAFTSARFSSVKFTRTPTPFGIRMHTLKHSLKKANNANIVHTVSTIPLSLYKPLGGVYFMTPFSEYIPTSGTVVKTSFNLTQIIQLIPNNTTTKYAITEESDYISFVNQQPAMVLADEDIDLNQPTLQYEFKFEEIDTISKFAIFMYFPEATDLQLHSYNATIFKQIPNDYILDRNNLLSSCNLDTHDCYVPWGYPVAIETKCVSSDVEQFVPVTLTAVKRSGFIRFILVLMVAVVPIAFDGVVLYTYFAMKRKGIMPWEGSMFAGRFFNAPSSTSERSELL